MTNEFIVIKDHKKEIKFWINALTNPNVSHDNKVLINKCLNCELNNYLSPFQVLEQIDNREELRGDEAIEN